jgi:hypothetical protein
MEGNENEFNRARNAGNEELQANQEQPIPRVIDDNVEEAVHDGAVHDAPIPHILGLNDPRRMKLTREEYLWALEFKTEVEQLPELDNLSDFMYAQFAIIARGGNLDGAIQRAFGLQEFRHEYAIMGNLQDGQRQMHQLMKLYPQDLVSFSYSHDEGAYVLIRDIYNQI